MIEFAKTAKLIVELGTGDGFTAAAIMQVLAPDAKLICINWPNPPSGDNPRRYLNPWVDDPRLIMLFGDTREISWAVPNGIDLLHIDSTHTNECAQEEWRLYQPKLAPNAIVVVDDLDHNDMQVFWDSLQGNKEVIYEGRIGVLRYGR